MEELDSAGGELLLLTSLITTLVLHGSTLHSSYYNTLITLHSTHYFTYPCSALPSVPRQKKLHRPIFCKKSWVKIYIGLGFSRFRSYVRPSSDKTRVDKKAGSRKVQSPTFQLSSSCRKGQSTPIYHPPGVKGTAVQCRGSKHINLSLKPDIILFFF